MKANVTVMLKANGAKTLYFMIKFTVFNNTWPQNTAGNCYQTVLVTFNTQWSIFNIKNVRVAKRRQSWTKFHFLSYEHNSVFDRTLVSNHSPTSTSQRLQRFVSSRLLSELIVFVFPRDYFTRMRIHRNLFRRENCHDSPSKKNVLSLIHHFSNTDWINLAQHWQEVRQSRY